LRPRALFFEAEDRSTKKLCSLPLKPTYTTDAFGGVLVTSSLNLLKRFGDKRAETLGFGLNSTISLPLFVVCGS
jgi:hypothetical protein